MRAPHVSAQGQVQPQVPAQTVFPGGSKEGIYENRILQSSRGSLCFQAGKRSGNSDAFGQHSRRPLKTGPRLKLPRSPPS